MAAKKRKKRTRRYAGGARRTTWREHVHQTLKQLEKKLVKLAK